MEVLFSRRASSGPPLVTYGPPDIANWMTDNMNLHDTLWIHMYGRQYPLLKGIDYTPSVRHLPTSLDSSISHDHF